jgi:tetratricopeptide (TPR) repeat protein
MHSLKGRQEPPTQISSQLSALHWGIICTDVEGFGDPRRTRADLVSVRAGLYDALDTAFIRSGVWWQGCYHEDRGDGVMTLVPPNVPKEGLVTGFPRELAAALGEHNRVNPAEARIRLRLAVHAGEVCFDEHGVVGEAVNLAFRLLEAAPLKKALEDSPGILAVIASRWFFEKVILPASAGASRSYRRVPVSVKETQTSGWICLHDDPSPSGQPAMRPAASVAAAALQLPRDGLSVGAARLVRLLRLHPGPDITLPAVASLAALAEGEARSALDELVRTQLVTQPVSGRFAFHDLMRVHPVGQADRFDADADEQAALRRMLDHYLLAANTAATRLHPRWEPVTLPALEPGTAPERFTGFQEAWDWFEIERLVLLAVIQRAAATGYITHAWQLSWALLDFFDRRGYWHDLAAIQRNVLDAVHDRADRRGEAHVHEALGISYRLLGRYDKARAHLRQALNLFGELGDQRGLADTLSAFIWWFQLQGCHHAALRRAEQALTRYRALDQGGQAHALSDIAWCHTLLHDDHQALIHGKQALTLFGELGDPHGTAHTLDTLGYAHRHLGHRKEAARCYGAAGDMHEELNDPYHQAIALDHLGDTSYDVGKTSAARAAWRSALDNLRQFPTLGPCPDGYPDISRIRAKLHQLGNLSEPPPAGSCSGLSPARP